MTDELYIGLMSGTSMDGIDAVLVELGDGDCTILAKYTLSYTSDLKNRLESAVQKPDHVSLIEFGSLNAEVGAAFAQAANAVLKAANLAANSVTAIGSHGQTVLHHPDGETPFSIQLGDPGILAARVGVKVVADFRSTDLALGGQGAPLAPAFHRWAFGNTDVDRAVVNIGGIANITLLFRDGTTIGFDTGPGNTLLDQWCREHHEAPFDDHGSWAAQGTVAYELLEKLLADEYFSMAPPKSTGLEHFNMEWLRRHLKSCSVQPSYQDTQATLSECTAQGIASGIRSMQDVREVAICGGGARNTDLLDRIRRALPDCTVDSTDKWGVDPAWVEAIAFAWLARQRIRGKTTNIPDVTGASKAVSLGGIYLPPQAG